MRIINASTEASDALLSAIEADEKGECGARKYKWGFTGTITVDATWVMDGFELTQERLQEIIERGLMADLSFAREEEVSVTSNIISAPDSRIIKAEMGYKREAQA